MCEKLFIFELAIVMTSSFSRMAVNAFRKRALHMKSSENALSANPKIEVAMAKPS